MDYLLKASGIVVILFLFYYIFLRNETYFKSIRSYLLIGLLIVVSIPLVEIPVYIEQVTSQITMENFGEIASAQFIESQSFDWIQLLTSVYLLGVLIFSIKFLIQLISLGYLLSKHQIEKKGRHYFVETSKNISPFSFFNIIIYNSSQFSIEELDQIINHEKAHAIQWHSLDTILSHLLVITLWFNPFVWLYKKAVQQNLEFLADAYAIRQVNNQKNYQLTLLKTCGATYCTELTNNFYNSLIKKRIVMLHKDKSKNNSQWKYALLLPLLVAFVFTFNTKIIAQEKESKEVTETFEINSEIIDLIIDKNTTKEGLDEIKKTFKDEADLTVSFKGIKRNSDNEITAIKIDAKGKNVHAKFENNGTDPIKPIKISYDSEDNSISIGNAKKMHKSHYAYTIHEKDGNVKIKKSKEGNHVFVTSDGKKHTWTSKGDKSKHIELKVISEEGEDGEHVWIHESDGDDNVKVEVIEIIEGVHKVKVIENIKHKSHSEEVHEIEIIKEGKGEGENVFIVRKDGDKGKKYNITKKGDYIFIENDGENSLIFIDGKESTKEEMKALGNNKNEKIEILKGDKAIEKYGEKAKDGVIHITTKKE